MAAQHLPRNLARPSSCEKKNSLKRRRSRRPHKRRQKCVDAYL